MSVNLSISFSFVHFLNDVATYRPCRKSSMTVM